jgi:hypothetical protein
MALAGTRLRMDLDRIPLWCGDHVEIRQLFEDFACYLYLPRLKNTSILAGAVRDGPALLTWERDSFAYAYSFDQVAGRYRGLRGGQQVTIPDTDTSGFLVKPEVARRQLDGEAARAAKNQKATAAVTGVRKPERPQPVNTRRHLLPNRDHGVSTGTLPGPHTGRKRCKQSSGRGRGASGGAAGAQVRVTLEIEGVASGRRSGEHRAHSY